jgi:polysaccharide export outer membrane protein
MKSTFNRFAFVLSMFSMLLSSCIPHDKLKYVQDETSTEIKPVYQHIRPEKRIRPFDNLYINVMSIDEQTARIFSNQNNSINGELNVNLFSYTVNERGAIDFPFIGDIFLSGLTLTEAKVKVESELSQYLSNTAITMKFVNSNITVLGEVRNQGEFPFFKEQINIFQALGYAGGITDYGDKSKVTLIREHENEFRYSYLNLTDKKIVESPYFYLEPGDVVIVDAVNLKNKNLRPFSYTSFLATITTIVTVLIFLQ